MLDGVTITNGRLLGHACSGGVYCDSSSPRLTNCSITSNAAYSGGGVCCNQSSPILANCIINGNEANGVYSRHVPTGSGGGLYCYQGDPKLIECIIDSNSATGSGGGVYSSQSGLVLLSCTIRGNWTIFSRRYGGGVACSGGEPKLSKCIIHHNFTQGSPGWGGGVSCYSSDAILTHCTFGHNAADSGGGVYCESSSLTLNSTIIAFSSAGEGIYFHNSSACTVEYCDIFGNSDGDIAFYEDDPFHGPPGIGELVTINVNCDSCDAYLNIFLDPLFVNPPTDDMHLIDSSPCIGAGDPTNPPGTDVDGNPRPNPPGSLPDIGAYEHWLAGPVGHLVLSISGGNAVLDWPAFGRTYNIYGAAAPFVSGTLLDTVTDTTWTDVSTSSRPSPYFYYVRATEGAAETHPGY